ncbi:proline racemase family protein [Stieleria marina]
MIQRIHTIDSHTAGEPTRVIVDGAPDLGTGSVADQLVRFRESFDAVRCGVVREPRGSDVLVGAMLCKPADPSCDAGVIFFNNVGFLGMCGHGLIGVVQTLKELGRLSSDSCLIETAAGVVSAKLNDDGSISVDNVASYRIAKDVEIQVQGIGNVVGDIAWGGNWFFLVKTPACDLHLSRVRQLQDHAGNIRSHLNSSGFPDVDHVELFGPPTKAGSHSQNFVLCPGLEYDRSPCGTGTSAKLACLAEDGKLMPGERWVQEGILGTAFECTYRWMDETKSRIIPTISGTAFITSESTLRFDSDDPFREGIR